MNHETGYPLKIFFLCGLSFAFGDDSAAKKGWPFAGGDEAKKIAKKIEGETKLECDTVFEDFSSSKPGSFPEGWRVKYEHNDEEARRDKIYVVEKDKDKGNVLKATYGTHTITVLKSLEKWDLSEFPAIQWEWKASILPTGADESDSDKNDSAASTYVVWNVGFPMQAKALRFAWSSSLKEGTFFQRRANHDNVLILESGSKNLNKWQTETVNVRDLYNEHILLSEKYRQPFVLALTTDADDTSSKAQAYWANFKFCREVAK
ncbi:DUF3047 domain-containing protein [bacterium]|nr:DUF3047 domain-containing protein [bacterium]